MQNLTVKPDLQTRESVMFAAGRGQFSVRDTETGEVRYVKVEAKKLAEPGAGSKYVRGTVPLDQATHVFVSEKGYGTPRIGTYYPPKPGYDSGRFFVADGMDDSHPHVQAFMIVLEWITGDWDSTNTAEVEVESRCGLCGHKLEDPVSVQRGIGPECAAKPTGSKILQASAFGQQAFEDTIDGALPAPGPDVLPVEAAATPVVMGAQQVSDTQAKVDYAAEHEAELAEATQDQAAAILKGLDALAIKDLQIIAQRAEALAAYKGKQVAEAILNS